MSYPPGLTQADFDREMDELGSLCPNCGAFDEPCATWCAAQDPRTANREQKRAELVNELTTLRDLEDSNAEPF